MAIKTKQRGFALFVAVIFMSVMLTFGLALGSLGYKQQVLASAAIESQYAFYAADAALECALHADQQLNLFAHSIPRPSSAPLMVCAADTAFSSSVLSWNANQWVVTERFSLDSDTRCADITVYKPASASDTTYIFSQGYNVSCATVAAPGDARFSSRGLNVRYP
mgnify:CR=1 FL=1